MSVEKNVPEIRFEGFNGKWDEKYLGDSTDIRSAARVHKEQWTEAGVPFFRTSDVVSIYKGQENTKAFISYEVYQSLSEKIGKVTKDDLLITGGGSIGIPYLVPNNDPLYFKDADLLWLKNNKKFDGYFLYTFFFSEPFRSYIKSISHTGTIAHYTIEQAKATPINSCEESEQTQIGNYFQKLDNLINQHQQKHDKLSNIKKAMLEKMFPKQGETIPEIRFKGFSGEWEEKALSEIIEIIGTGKSIFVANEVSTELNKYAILGSRGVIGYDDTYDYSGNFILTARVGENAGRLYKHSGEVKITDNTVFIKSNNLDFVFYLLTNFDLRRLAFGTGQPLIKASELNSLKLFFPFNKPEQTQIGNYFQKLDTLINQHQQQITKLKTIKQACLSKMFV